MGKSASFFIVDDDRTSIEVLYRLLTSAGHVVHTAASSVDALAEIQKIKPDCVICDLVMPGQDGFELLRQIRQLQACKQPKFIIVSSKSFDYDKRKAFALGADGYMIKPINPETFVNEVTEIVADKMTARFFGVRGTLPAPGRLTARYGGHTNCVMLAIAKKHIFIFDAGTAIKALSDYFLSEKMCPLSAKIFITHPHYDHINGIPFFAPLYMKGNEFEFLGPNHQDISINDLIGKQMDSVYFPVTMKEFASTISFRSLDEGNHDVDGVNVQALLLNHPGKCLGYRVVYGGKSFSYITDNELVLESASGYNPFDVARLVEFIRGTDMLVIDATYTDAEYANKVGWGHSCLSRVADVAHLAGVKLLCLHHHDPSQVDKDIDEKVKVVRDILKSLKSKTKCIAPKEGDGIIV